LLIIALYKASEKDSVQVKIEQNQNKGMALLIDEGKHAAEMTFSIAGPELIIIDHTDVNENYRGQGLGRQLLDALVEKARNEKFKILPLCPYARSEFEKDPTLRDVLRS
jgi:hypothetical protein